MRDEDLDKVLSGEDEIVASSGFAASVMEAVQREAVTPPPIPFPWKRAVPGLAAWAAVLVSLLVAVVRNIGQAPSEPPAQWVAAVDLAHSFQAGWIALALLLSFVCVSLSMTLARRRS